MKFALLLVSATGVLAVSASGQAVVKRSIDVRHGDSVTVSFETTKAGHVQVDVEAWTAKYSADNPVSVRLTLVSTGFAYTRAGTRTFVPCNGTESFVSPALDCSFTTTEPRRTFASPSAVSSSRRRRPPSSVRCHRRTKSHTRVAYIRMPPRAWSGAFATTTVTLSDPPRARAKSTNFRASTSADRG